MTLFAGMDQLARSTRAAGSGGGTAWRKDSRSQHRGAECSSSVNATLIALRWRQTGVAAFGCISRPGSYRSRRQPQSTGQQYHGHPQLDGELIAKKIELMHEVVPNSAVIAVLVNPGYPNTDTQITDARAAQTSLGIKIQILQASTLSEIEAAFSKVVELRIGGLVITGDPYFHSEQEQIAALATRYAVPTVHYVREFVAAGGLMSYGADYAEAYRLVGGYTGRIIKGEKPADLPVQQSTKVELFINLKTAKALGLTLPEPLLGRADEVIE